MENFLIANCTDTGRVRSVNEDSMATFDSPNGRVVVVCDGMGGQNAGDVASQLAVTVIQDILVDNKFSTPEEAISKSIMAANQAILLRSAQNEDLSGMGATCVMLIITEGKVYYGSVGDSRIYYACDGNIRQITKDQSYVQTLVDAGEITQEAAEHHKDKNQITNALGLDGMTPPVVCQMPITPEEGSVFILCSDGLSGMVSNNIILKVASNSSKPLNERAVELVELANTAGGVDNITVQLVEFPCGVKNSVSAPKNASGGSTRGKKKKSHATMYWIAAILCLILAIGSATYWFVFKPEPKADVTPTVKTGKKTHKTPTAPKADSVSKPKVEQPKVVIVEKEKAPKSGNTKKVKKTQEELITGQKGNQVPIVNSEKTQEVQEITKGNFEEEKIKGDN